MTRKWTRLWLVGCCVVLTCAAGCAPSAEEVRQTREKGYLATIAVRGFRVSRSYYEQAAMAALVGPASLDPKRDIWGPGLTINVPPRVGGSAPAFLTIADGNGVGTDGVGCFVTVDRFRGARLFDDWGLTQQETQQVESGRALLITIGVVCGGPR